MTDNEFMAQMFLQAQTVREEVAMLRSIDVDAMVNEQFDRNFKEIFGGIDEPKERRI